MACSLRGLWVFNYKDSEIRLLMSRRWRTVERRVRLIQGEDYTPLPCDEVIQMKFFEILQEDTEDTKQNPNVPQLFRADFAQGSFKWNEEQEKQPEKLWPLGPICAIGDLWPVLFMFKKNVYLLTIVQLDRRVDVNQLPAVVELPEVTTAFTVLEDICDFLRPDLCITDVASISELQDYVKCALPFGAPVITNYQLLKKIRKESQSAVAEEKELPGARVPAWKPYLHKGKAKLSISIMEQVNATMYGNHREYKDSCSLAGTVYCNVEIPGIPEIGVPLYLPGSDREISMHNCAQVVGGIQGLEKATVKLSCMPPTGPFVLCRYRYPTSPMIPIDGEYQIKEMSPVDFRISLHLTLHPVVAHNFTICQVRFPFHHRGVIRRHDVKCSGGTFMVTENSTCILWNLSVRRPRAGHPLKANLLGEFTFEAKSQGHNSSHTEGRADSGAQQTSLGMCVTTMNNGEQPDSQYPFGSGSRDEHDEQPNEDRELRPWWGDTTLYGVNAYAEVFMEVPTTSHRGCTSIPRQ
eukprot:GEMP01037971.1.p1 GENE.GEMP01037971.1~~GEMP01037971.1.p1  ORF type:complete len:522 (+),score=106.63 GEMP01037971.1:32-1597(+)